jgi:hypothetical protein
MARGRVLRQKGSKFIDAVPVPLLATDPTPIVWEAYCPVQPIFRLCDDLLPRCRVTRISNANAGMP